MKITLTRTGGFTAIPQRKTIDTDTLPPKQATELENLVIKSNIIGQQKSTPAKPDRFTYSISVQDEGINQSANINEASMDPDLRKLIEYLQNI